MSDSSDAVDDGTPKWPAHRFLRALWIVGISLTVFAIVTAVYSQVQFSNNYSAASTSSAGLLLAQIFYSFAVSAMTAGLVCMGLALAVSAVFARLDAAPIGGPVPIGPSASPDTVPEVAPAPPRDGEGLDPVHSPPAAAPGSHPRDHDRFRRPSPAADTDARNVKHRRDIDAG